MRSALLGMAAVTLVIAVAGCRDTVEPQEAETFLVSRIEAPASIAAGSPLSVAVTVNIGCSRIERFEIQRNVSGADITVRGPNPASDIMCTMSKLEKRTVTFDPPFASTFTLSANRGTTVPIEVTVEVM